MLIYKGIRVLLLEDDPGLAKLLQKRLRPRGYVVDIAYDGKSGLTMYHKAHYDILVLDQNMPEYDGLEVLRRIADPGPFPPVIMLTGAGNERIAVEAMKLGASDYIVKDIDGCYLDLLPSIFQRALNQQNLVKEKQWAEKTLKKSEELLRDLFENTSDLIQSVSPDEKFVYVNPSWRKTLGYSKKEVQDLSLFDIIHSEHTEQCRNVFKRVLSGENVTDVETVFVSKKGKEIIVEGNISCKRENGKAIQTRGIFRDITTRKQLEQEKEKLQSLLLQSQKMESIGRLAGGVAHEFNNLLTGIIGFSELSLGKIEENAPLREDVESIKKAAKQASTLAHHLLTFSRKRKIEFEILNINDIIENAEIMLKHLLSENITLVLNFATNLKSIESDSELIKQLVVNLATNAHDAMPEGGTFEISTSNKTVNEDESLKMPEAHPGNFVCLSVKDTGVGMNKDIIHRMFEPFFGTKDIGKGTGLGLSVVYGIVKQHKGWITVESKPGQGTEFRIFLPVYSRRQKNMTENKNSLIKSSNSGKSILVVEDEGIVRDLAVRVLREGGYDVSEAANSKEAKDVFMTENGNFNLVFSDVVMPGETGPQLVDQLLFHNPQLHVLFSSGYSDERSKRHILLDKGFPFLQKPYTPSDLLLVVEDLIGKG